MKKVLLGIVSITLLVGSFFGGVYYKDRRDDRAHKAALTPAMKLIDSMVSGNKIDEEYDAISPIYKEVTPKEEYKKFIAPLKDAVVDGSSTYVGDVENINVYKLIKPEATYEVVINSAENTQKWEVTSVSISQQQQQ